MAVEWRRAETDQVASEKLRPYLASDERLIWSDRPRRGVVFRQSDLYLVPFSIVWLSFALFWEFSVLPIPTSSPVFPFFPLFGLFFVCLGLYQFIGRFVNDALLRSRTYYGVTNRRILILSSLGPPRLTFRDLAALGPLSVVQGSNGQGTITFGSPASTSWLRKNRSQVPRPPTFEMIPNVREVDSEIQRAARKVQEQE